MSLFHTAQSLGLKCITVPIMSREGYRGPTDLYEPRFLGFNGAASGNYPLDEYGPYWGFKMPQSKITWLNLDEGEEEGKEEEEDDGTDGAQGKTFKDVQMVFMTVR